MPNPKTHLLSDGAQTAIATRKKTSPHRKLPSHDGRPRGAIANGPGHSCPLGGLPRALSEVPDAAPDGPEGEGAPDVLDDAVGTGIAVGDVAAHGVLCVGVGEEEG